MELTELRQELRAGWMRALSNTNDLPKMAALLEAVRSHNPMLADAMPDASTMLRMTPSERRAAQNAALWVVGMPQIPDPVADPEAR